ncbi:unnamed protein product [Onchocerca flexuosa]|uniref:30S ribosomal protein S8 n=1 Tax=Onchocerca flexuosa TaxID=387005 RepID=A0A183HUA7_9BILA|nr:unnamed protein product [Onchocerca flexuosa]
MACLLLASKIEEAPRRPRDVINVFHRLEHLHGKRNESKKIYANLKKRTIGHAMDAIDTKDGTSEAPF